MNGMTNKSGRMFLNNLTVGVERDSFVIIPDSQIHYLFISS